VILPTGDTVIQAPDSTGASVFKEFWYTMVAFASDAQGFDGNGSYTRTATGGGDLLVRTDKLSGRPKNRDILYGHALNPPIGTQPTRPSSKPPYKTNVDCYKNARPNLNGPAAAPGRPDKIGK
jgi:phospholipid/cholesterol/gamma-HCH transport system substrate-binding protein